MTWKDEYKKHFRLLKKLGRRLRNHRKKGMEKLERKLNKLKKKTASSPCQDLHPDWDRFRGTMLYPLSCGELAMKGEQILR